MLVKTKEELLNDCTTSDQLFVEKNEELLYTRDKISLLEEQRTTARRNIQELKKTQKYLKKKLSFFQTENRRHMEEKEKAKAGEKKW